jgi:hypothetical protein
MHVLEEYVPSINLAMLSLIPGAPALALYAPTEPTVFSSHFALSITSVLYPNWFTSTSSFSINAGFSNKLNTCLKKVIGF